MTVRRRPKITGTCPASSLLSTQTGVRMNLPAGDLRIHVQGLHFTNYSPNNQTTPGAAFDRQGVETGTKNQRGTKYNVHT